MRKLLLMILLGSAILLPAQGEVVLPWFGDITKPAAITQAWGETFAASLREGLMKNTPLKELLAEVPEDTLPRVIFLTLFDGQFPSRCYFSSGFSLKDTLERLIPLVLRREKEYAGAISDELSAQLEQAKEEKRLLSPIVQKKLSRPNQWNALQIDIVQCVIPVSGFHIPSSKLLLSSAVGIAFDKRASFAFTPEQLTGRCLMTMERQLSANSISNLIAESTNWQAWRLWTQMCSADAKYNIFLFESDSFYADETGARSVFRGYPLRCGSAPVATDKLLESSRALLSKIAALITKQGQIEAPFLEWLSENSEGGESVYSLIRLADILALQAQKKNLPKEQREIYLTTCRTLAKQMLKCTKHYDAGEKRSSVPETTKKKKKKNQRRKAGERDFACVIEPELLEKSSIDDHQIPRRIAALNTNALALKTYIDLTHALGLDDATGQNCHQQLKPLMAHIFAQFNRECDFISARIYPENDPLLTNHTDHDELTQTASLCGLAAMAYANEMSEKDVLDKRAMEFAHAIHGMLSRKFFTADTEKGSAAAPLRPLLARFMGQLCTPADKALQRGLLRMALDALKEMDTAPMLPDMYGTHREIPSLTYAAELHWLCVEVANALATCGRVMDSQGILQDGWPLWVFSQHAPLIDSVASALPQPYKYIGFCRDNLADFAFTLDGQLTAVEGTTALADYMTAFSLPLYKPTPIQQKEYEALWNNFYRHPRCLSAELVVSSAVTGEYNSRKTTGKLDKPTVSRTQTKAKYRRSTPTPNQRISTKVLTPPPATKK